MSKNFDNVQRSEYPTLSARVESDVEPITWDVVINLKYCLLLNRYQKLGYPLGKTKRGLKRWLLRRRFARLANFRRGKAFQDKSYAAG